MKQESRGGWRSEHKMDNMDSRELGHCVIEEGMSRLSLENPGELESGSPPRLLPGTLGNFPGCL